MLHSPKENSASQGFLENWTTGENNDTTSQREKDAGYVYCVDRFLRKDNIASQFLHPVCTLLFSDVPIVQLFVLWISQYFSVVKENGGDCKGSPDVLFCGTITKFFLIA